MKENTTIFNNIFNRQLWCFWTIPLCRPGFHNYRSATVSRKVVLPSLSCHLPPPPHLSKRFSCFKDSQPSCNRVHLYILDSHAVDTDNWRALQGKLQSMERKCKIRKLKFQSIITSSSNAQKKYQSGKVWHPEGKKAAASVGISIHSREQQISSLLLADAYLVSKMSHWSIGTFRLVGHYTLAIFCVYACQK